MSLPPYKNKGVRRSAVNNSDVYQLSGVDITTSLAAQAVSGATTAVATGVVASTTHTLAGATQLSGIMNFVATAANSGDAVKLPALLPGQSVTVFNDGASPIAVYPAAATVAIDGGSAGASVTLTNAKRATFFCKTATAITSAQLGIASA